MKSWQAILISGALIAGAIIIRAEPINSAFAAFYSDDVAECIVDAANNGAGLGQGAGILLQACTSLHE